MIIEVDHPWKPTYKAGLAEFISGRISGLGRKGESGQVEEVKGEVLLIEVVIGKMVEMMVEKKLMTLEDVQRLLGTRDKLREVGEAGDTER